MTTDIAVLHDLADVGVWFVTWSIMSFLVVYTRGFTDWRWAANMVGRTIVALDLCLLLLLIPACAQKAIGHIAFFESITWQYVAVGDGFLVGVIALTRAVTWAREYHRGDPWYDNGFPPSAHSVGVPEDTDSVEH